MFVGVAKVDLGTRDEVVPTELNEVGLARKRVFPQVIAKRLRQEARVKSATDELKTARFLILEGSG